MKKGTYIGQENTQNSLTQQNWREDGVMAIFGLNHAVCRRILKSKEKTAGKPHFSPFVRCAKHEKKSKLEIF